MLSIPSRLVTGMRVRLQDFRANEEILGDPYATQAAGGDFPTDKLR